MKYFRWFSKINFVNHAWNSEKKYGFFSEIYWQYSTIVTNNIILVFEHIQEKFRIRCWFVNILILKIEKKKVIPSNTSRICKMNFTNFCDLFLRNLVFWFHCMSTSSKSRLSWNPFAVLLPKKKNTTIWWTHPLCFGLSISFCFESISDWNGRDGILIESSCLLPENKFPQTQRIQKKWEKTNKKNFFKRSQIAFRDFYKLPQKNFWNAFFSFSKKKLFFVEKTSKKSWRKAFFEKFWKIICSQFPPVFQAFFGPLEEEWSQILECFCSSLAFCWFFVNGWKLKLVLWKL